MPITVVCTCGKRMGVADALAGRSIKCQKCGEMGYIPAPSSAAGTKPSKEKSNIAVDIGPGKLALIIALVGIVVGIILFVTGPVKCWHQWEDQGPQATQDVKDVISFGLEAYLSQIGEYDPSRGGQMPAVEEDVAFLRPLMTMSLPEKIKFGGMSNQGKFVGYYYPGTGEIEADVEYRAVSVLGGLNLTKATNSFQLTGRIVNGNPVAESQGKPLTIVFPPKSPK